MQWKFSKMLSNMENTVNQKSPKVSYFWADAVNTIYYGATWRVCCKPHARMHTRKSRCNILETSYTRKHRFLACVENWAMYLLWQAQLAITLTWTSCQFEPAFHHSTCNSFLRRRKIYQALYHLLERRARNYPIPGTFTTKLYYIKRDKTMHFERQRKLKKVTG